MEAEPLTRPEFAVLDACRDARLRSPRASSQRALSAATGLSLGYVNRAVRRVRDRGLLDGWTLTSDGWAALAPHRARNLVVLATDAGRLSFERPAGLLAVRGEVLVERLIRQARAAGLAEVVVLVGRRAEQFWHLEDAFSQESFRVRVLAERGGDVAALLLVGPGLGNSYLCPADVCLAEDVIAPYVFDSFYAAVRADQGVAVTPSARVQASDPGMLVAATPSGRITGPTRGGAQAWALRGPAYWDRAFTSRFMAILNMPGPKTAAPWQAILAEHATELTMRVRAYPDGAVETLDTLDRLRAFDPGFTTNVDAAVLDAVCAALGCGRDEPTDFAPLVDAALAGSPRSAEPLANAALPDAARAASALAGSPRSAEPLANAALPYVALADAARTGSALTGSPRSAEPLAHAALPDASDGRAFRFAVRSRTYVCRPPDGRDAAALAVQKRVETIAASLGLDDAFVSLDPDTGWSVSRLVAPQFDPHDPAQARAVAVALRALHSCGQMVEARFDPYAEALGLIARLERDGHAGRLDFPDFAALREQADALAALCRADAWPEVLCHNGVCPGAVAVVDGRASFTGWERAGMGDPAGDLALLVCCGDAGWDDVADLVADCLDRAPTPAELRHVAAQIGLVGFHWWVWSVWRDARGQPAGPWAYRWYRCALVFGARALQAGAPAVQSDAPASQSGAPAPQ